MADGIDGVLAYHQSLRQLAIGSNALHKEVQHLAFAIRQFRRSIGGSSRCRRGSRELAQELSGESRRESGFAAGDTLEESEKLVGVEVLEEIALRAAFDRFKEIGVVLGGSEDDNFSRSAQPR